MAPKGSGRKAVGGSSRGQQWSGRGAGGKSAGANFSGVLNVKG